MDPILIVLLKIIQAKFEIQKWGARPPEKYKWGPSPVRLPPGSATYVCEPAEQMIVYLLVRRARVTSSGYLCCCLLPVWSFAHLLLGLSHRNKSNSTTS